MKKNFVIVLKIIFNIDANILNKILKNGKSSLIVTTKVTKYLGINLSRNVKNLYLFRC